MYTCTRSRAIPKSAHETPWGTALAVSQVDFSFFLPNY
jgi:hypothetical protein